MREEGSLVLASLLVLSLAGGRTQEPAPPQRIEPPKLPLVYGVAPRGDKEIRIDGDASDWPSLRQIPLHLPFQITGGKEYRGQTDLAGRAYFCWDPDHLYLVVAVLDDFHRPWTPLSPILNPAGPSGDGVHLRFDPRRDTRSLGRVPERTDDLELWLGGLGEKGCRVLRIDRPAGTITEEPRIQAAFRREAAGKEAQPFILWYEARIPWSLILPKDVDPGPNLAIGLEIVLEDFDSPIDPLPQTRLGWTFGSSGILYPGQQGTAVLLEQPLARGVEMGEPPPRPMPTKNTTLGAEPVEFWEELSRELGRNAPLPGPPAVARKELLGRLDRSLAAWPALDLGLLVARYQRGMVREVAGLMDRGAPAFLRLRSRVALEALASATPSRGSVRLIRLPWSGWLVRSQSLTMAIDPFLPGLHREVHKIDGLLLTSALDPMRRDDPLAFGILGLKRVLLAHHPVLVPLRDTDKLPRVLPKDNLNLGELVVTVLGPGGEAPVIPDQLGFEIHYLPAGPRLVFGGGRFEASWLAQPGPALDVLVLPAGHPDLVETVARLEPRLLVVSDLLDFPLQREGEVDLRLDKALETLGKVTVPWLILAWGEAVTVPLGGS